MISKWTCASGVFALMGTHESGSGLTKRIKKMSVVFSCFLQGYNCDRQLPCMKNLNSIYRRVIF